MPWYDAVNKFIRRDYPGSYKQSAAGPLKSDRILGSMAKAPRGARGKQVIRKFPAFPKRQPVKRASSKKRKRLAPRGKFKKPKKVRKIGTKYHNHRYEQEGTCNAGQPFMYISLNDMYSTLAVWDAMADALLRPILAKEFKFYPLQDTDKIGDINTLVKSTLVFDFKRIKSQSGEQVLYQGLSSDGNLANQRVDCDNVTYDTMRTRMSTVLRLMADGNINTAPIGDTVANYPVAYHTMTYTGTSSDTAIISVVSTYEHLEDMIIDLKFTQRTSFTNRTLADGGGADGVNTDRMGLNPLKGMLYECNHHQPRVYDHVDMSAGFRQALQSMDYTTGIDKHTTTDAADSHMAHPLSAKFWLKNCVKESKILLQPGQTKTHATVKTIKGKLSTLIERLYYSGFDKGNFGTSAILMFDLVHKTDQTPTTVYKRSCLVQSAGKLKQPRLYVPDFEVTTNNL